MRRFIPGFTAGVLVTAAAAALAATPATTQCSQPSLHDVDDRVDRLESLVWALHAPEGHKRRALTEAGVQRALINMRTEQRARDMGALSCYPEEDR